MAKSNIKFKLGQTVVTCGVDEYLKKNNPALALTLLAKHLNLEQGDLCDADYQQNLDAIKNEGKKDDNGNLMQDRIFSSYTINGEKFWVITEWDRSVTTILFPDEY
jgi:hypothetical protein